MLVRSTCLYFWATVLSKILYPPLIFVCLLGAGRCEFSKTDLKHRQVIGCNRTNEPQAPACPLRGFVCPLCGDLLSAGV